MGRTEIESIIRLLEDPDNQVFEGIKSVIVENFGEFSGELTRRLYSGECSDIEKMRIAEVAQLSISRIFLNEFQNYTARLTPEPSLLAGTVMIEKIADNTFDALEFSHYMRELSRRVWLRLSDNTSLETLRVIRDVFEEENIFADETGQTLLNGLFSNDNKPLPSSLLNLVFLIVCQENGINIRPVLIPTKNGRAIEIGYVNLDLAKASNVPSKHGAIFAIDSKLQLKRDPRIFLAAPLPYYKYLKYWQYDRYHTIMENPNKYPGYYSVIMKKINEVLDKSIKY